MGVICKYKYDSSIYADLIPTFNSGYSGYVITDEVEGNIIIRTIESDELPTLMRFGSNLGTYVEGGEVALLEILEMNTSELVTCYRMFRCCTNLINITCEWNTSNVTRMDGMFTNCSSLTSLDVSDFDTSKVTHMNAMFNGCANLTTLDVSNFNTSNVTDMNRMFYNCNKLTSLDVSNFDTNKVTDMNNMFYICNKLTSLDVSNFNTSNVTNMNAMFSNGNNLTSLDVSNWNTSKVTTMQQTFYNCKSLTSLDVSNWDTSNVTSMNLMFSHCYNLTLLDVSNWNTSKVNNMNYMFYNCNNLTSLDLSNWDTSNATNTVDMFVNTNSLEVITMFNSNINTINVVGNLTSATIYVDESLDQSQYTGAVPLKVYKEEKLEIKLNSPLLEGDTIEVVDGKICHVHRMCEVVLDGSEDWKIDTNYIKPYFNIIKHNYPAELQGKNLGTIYSDNFIGVKNTDRKNKEISIGNNYQFSISINDMINVNDYSGSILTFKQWLSENPTTVVYELAEPYYEDITPLQSSITLKTFLESSMTIDTILPIETKLSYRTNVPSISTLSTRATELAESDNVIHNLMNIIDDEVDE